MDGEMIENNHKRKNPHLKKKLSILKYMFLLIIFYKDHTIFN